MEKKYTEVCELLESANELMRNGAAFEEVDRLLEKVCEILDE